MCEVRAKGEQAARRCFLPRPTVGTRHSRRTSRASTNRWYLSVTPTYHFTSDGRWPSRRGEFLSNAKRRERNDSVRQQLEMWARYLTGVADYAPPEYPLLVLAAPLAVEVDAGIDDKAWLRQDDEAVEGESEPWGCR